MIDVPRIPQDLARHELKVLIWNEHFYGDDYLQPVVVNNPHGPDIYMQFTDDRSEIAEVDALWFHGPTLKDMPPRAEKRVPWVLMSMESNHNYPGQDSQAARLTFDIFMTYRLDSDVPCIYPSWHHYGDFKQAPAAHAGPSQGALAAYIASHAVAHRDELVAELMQYVPVDSLGRCLNNASLDDFVVGTWDKGGWESVLSVLPHYKFYLALENSCTRDYVTERVFHSLVCGSVPIYLGAENVREFMPDDDAIILASDFPSVRALADYLLHLDSDDEAYQRHLAWKQRPHREAFTRLLDFGSSDPRERLAIKLAHACDRSCGCGGRQQPAAT